MVEATHRIRLGKEAAHYGNDLVAGGYLMLLFGDIVTELTVRNDGDGGLILGYKDVRFMAPVYAGDYLELRGRIVRVGNTSRDFELEAWKYGTSKDVGQLPSNADILDEPVLVATAKGTTVVKKERQRKNAAEDFKAR